MSINRQTATHEAGHALLVTACDWLPLAVLAVPVRARNQQAAGITLYNPPPRADIVDHVAIALASTVAERMRGFDASGCGQDHEDAAADLAPFRSADQRRIAGLATDRVVDVLTRYAITFDTLTEKLVAQGNLFGLELMVLLNPLRQAERGRKRERLRVVERCPRGCWWPPGCLQCSHDGSRHRCIA